MDIEKIIKKIVDDGNVEYMHELSELLEDTLEIIQKYDDDCYKKIKMKLYIMAYGKNINKEMAEEIVNDMKPYGQHWNIEQTQQIQEQTGAMDINAIDFYIVANQGFNDYNNLYGDDIEKIAIYVDDFVNDIDGKPNKVFWYFMPDI